MLVTLVNLTHTSLVCLCNGAYIHQSLQTSHSLVTTGVLPSDEQRKEAEERKHPEAVLLAPSSGLTTQWSTPRKRLTLRAALGQDQIEKSRGATGEFTVSLSFGFAQWKVQTVPANCHYRVYSRKLSNDHYNVVIIPKRDMSSFLRQLPDILPISSVLLPGTHETMAVHGWPFSQCQSSTLGAQLQSGIRVIDIRISVIKGKLISYHGIYPQRTPFSEILDILHEFLTTSTQETVIMSIKQEDFRTTPWLEFSRLVLKEIKASPGGLGLWFLENRIPRLGEVRGKVVMFSRFGGTGECWENGTEGMGIHPYRWPDSAKLGFTWDLKGTIVRTHDWYEIPSFLAIPEKFMLASSTLLPPVNNPPAPVLSISFFSAASFPLALPPVIAQGFGFPNFGFGVEGINSRLGRWLLDLFTGVIGSDVHPVATTLEPSEKGTEGIDAKEIDRERDIDKVFKVSDPRIRGWALLDYFDDPADQLVPLLVECNFG